MAGNLNSGLSYLTTYLDLSNNRGKIWKWTMISAFARQKVKLYSDHIKDKAIETFPRFIPLKKFKFKLKKNNWVSEDPEWHISNSRYKPAGLWFQVWYIFPKIHIFDGISTSHKTFSRPCHPISGTLWNILMSGSYDVYIFVVSHSNILFLIILVLFQKIKSVG